eukprot:gene17238-22764_t
MSHIELFLIFLLGSLVQSISLLNIGISNRNTHTLSVASLNQAITTSLQRPIPSAVSTTSALNDVKSMKEVIRLPYQSFPWSRSVSETASLTYMDMFMHELSVIESLGMEKISIDEKFVYQTSTTKSARIASLSFRNEQYRYVRLTYFDGGDSVQVLNTLWYPAYEYDVPMLGVDLISLGQSRVLSVIDLQPLHPTLEYSNKYIDRLTPIRNKYPDLHGTLSGKFYDDTSFFSKNMLFGRFTDNSKINPVVNPAFKEYLNAYVDIMSTAEANHDPVKKSEVFQRQKQYDTYSALKDPAVGLFDAYFGKEWSNSFVHDYLFPLAKDIHVEPAHKFTINSSGDLVPNNSNRHTNN